jgi:hypothetical protein
MRLTLLLILTLCFSSVAFAQEQERPLPDRWRGLVIDKSTPEDAIARLGQPTKDSQSAPRTYPLNKRVRIDHNMKEVRRLAYEKLEGVSKANLYFKDGTLLIIELELKPGLPATTFPHVYGIDFWPKVSNMQLSLEPGEFERNEGRIYPKNYPLTYHLIGQTDTVYVSAWVDKIQIISRRYEKTVGVDALK